MRDACTGHTLPFSCVRTCAVHVQATPCLSTVFVHARCVYRPPLACQLCSDMRDACTGHTLPVSCVRTCAMHAQATPCLLSTYMRDACTGPCASARRPAPLKGRACGRRVGCSAKALRLELLREALDVGEVLEEGHAVAAWAVQRGPARRPVGFGDVKGRPCGRRVGCSARPCASARGLRRREREAVRSPRGLFREGRARRPVGFGDLKLPSGSSCDRPQGYVASPARCVRSMRFRVGPEHNNVFVIYAVDVTLAGNSQAMRRKTSLPHYSA